MKSLVESAKAGEEKAKEDLYSIFFPRVFHYVSARLSNNEDAEDVTCEIFIRVLTNLENYEDRGSPIGGWIFMIARNEVVTHVRRSQIRETVPFQIEKMAVEDKALTIVDPFDLKRMNDCVGKIPPAQKAVIISRFYEDRNVRETANALGKTENNVKVLQHKAIHRLKELMGVDFNTTTQNQAIAT